YFPEGRGFVCYNGNNRFTRALYGGHTNFRLETSDRPVFAIFSKEYKRNIQFFLHTPDGKKVNFDKLEMCAAYYYPGERKYYIRNSSLGIDIVMTAICSFDTEEAIWQILCNKTPKDAEIECVVSSIREKKLWRNGDIGVEKPNCFEASETDQPLQINVTKAEKELYIKYTDASVRNMTLEEGRMLFATTEKQVNELANRVVINTPDKFINTLGGVLTSAADGIWDESVWLHGAVGWRSQLPGWRAGYTGDCLGWHDRARTHFDNYGESMITNIEPKYGHPMQDASLNYARAEKKWGTQMYSNGYITRHPNSTDQMNHYDMNLCYIDELLWHLNWTGDLEYARKMWPKIKLHLAWEKRNFDPDNNHLYDGYACIWASDGLYYDSGDVTHSTSYNYRANKMAAEIAELIGEDATPYRKEADEILKAINSKLWMNDRGVWAEFNDYMGLKRQHDTPAVWTVYHAIDSDVATPYQAFRATEYVTNNIPHIPIKSSGMTKDDELINVGNYATISTSNWMPYNWSINNVAFAEVMHTALAYFQADNKEAGFKLMKSSILDGMYMGSCPGNIGQISYYDAARGECYRDFGDPVGMASRMVIQGLYGIKPDAMHKRLSINPGFPKEWDNADITTPDISYSYKRNGVSDKYEIKHNFETVDTVTLRIPIRYTKFDIKNTCQILDYKCDNASFNQPHVIFKLLAKAGQKISIELKGKGDAISNRKAKVVRQNTGLALLQQENRAWWVATAIDESERDMAWLLSGQFTNIDVDSLEPIDISKHFNANVTDIFRNRYESPRSPYTTLTIPIHGYSEWCHPKDTVNIDDSGLRNAIKDSLFIAPNGVKWLSPKDGNNIVYTSLFDNYPNESLISVSGKASHAYLMMAGSTNPMQCNINNAVVEFLYTDDTVQKYPLYSPVNWAPIEQAFFEDGQAFDRHAEPQYRLCLKTGKVSSNLQKELGVKGAQIMIDGGAGIILDVPLDKSKRLKYIRLRTLSNNVVAGLMGITLQR
ncbi:MAG: DUF4450 domain-containing protein, partial [Bacteroidaceae bacterium]|nr:DUF4450 domain-containing protein [Bacteroidaceae bacterium]